MMIDDITIAGPAPVSRVPDGFQPATTAPGRPAAFGAPAGNGLYVTISPETGIMTVRISVTRYLRDSPTNFPLVALRGVGHLKLDLLASRVGLPLGIQLSMMGGDASRRFPFRDWAVVRASYAVDLRVRDPISCVEGAMGLRRRNAGTRHVFGREKFTTILWGSRSLQVTLYAKQDEIESHSSEDERRAGLLAQRAAQARGVLRFEVRLKQVAAIRRMIPGMAAAGHLPKLALMCDPRVAQWVVRREARRLRLNDNNNLGQVTSLSSHVRRVVDVLREAQVRMAEREFELGRVRSLTEDRLRLLALTHFLAAGLTTSELEGVLGLSRPAVAELRNQLQQLGLAPDSSPRTTLGQAVGEIQDALTKAGVYEPTNFTDLNDGNWSVPAPWLTEEEPLAEVADEEGEDGQVEDAPLGPQPYDDRLAFLDEVG